MALRIFNTLSGQKEEFQSITPGEVTMYVCGPTVYASTHIGHAMSYIVFDVIRRYLEYRGYTVRHAQNFTDIDDKIIKRAAAIGVEWQQLTEQYIGEFLRVMDALNVQRATVYPRATGEIPEILAFIEGLIAKGVAYPVEGDVYFRVESKADYGKLAHRTLTDMNAGERVEIDLRKEHPMDFALWKAAKPGEPAWDSPWGAGRPGWHIECSAMAMHHLGDQMDIHGGGRDLIFPHHENEIAQSESLTGRVPFARYWMHNGLLELGGKMSKSEGNVINVQKMLERGDDFDALRAFYLSSLYRNPLNFSQEAYTAAAKGLEKLRALYRPDFTRDTGAGNVEAEAAVRVAGVTAREHFVEAMDDDFNTAQAMAALFDLVKEINRAKEAGANAESLRSVRDVLTELGGVLGLRLTEITQQFASNADGPDVAKLVELMLQLRRDLRAAKNYAMADSLRTNLQELGIIIEDGREGTSWHYQRPGSDA